MATIDRWGDAIITLNRAFQIDKPVTDLLEQVNDPGNGLRDEDDPEFTREQVEKAYLTTIEAVIDSITSWPGEWMFEEYRRDYSDKFKKALKEAQREAAHD